MPSSVHADEQSTPVQPDRAAAQVRKEEHPFTPGWTPPPDPRPDPPPTPGRNPPPTPGRNPPPTPSRNPPPDPRLDPSQLPPPPQVLTDSWGVCRISTGCSRPPPRGQKAITGEEERTKAKKGCKTRQKTQSRGEEGTEHKKRDKRQKKASKDGSKQMMAS